MNQLSLENEQLERTVNEKENAIQQQAQTLKDIEKRLQTLSSQKEELEKVRKFEENLSFFSSLFIVLEK